MSENLSQIGQLIHLVRTQHHISQSELAQLAMVHQATISRVEKGNPNIKLDVYNKVLNALNLSLLDEDHKNLDSDFRLMYSIYDSFTKDESTDLDIIYQRVINYRYIHIKEYPIFKLILVFYHYIKKNKDQLNHEINLMMSIRQEYQDYYSLKYNQMLGLYHLSNDEYEKSLHYFEQSFIYCENYQIDDGLIFYHYGYLHFFLGNFTTCILSISKAQKIYKKNNNVNRLNHIAYLIGLVYMNDQNYKEAERIFLSCLNDEFYIKTNKSAYFILNRNLGLIKFYQKDFNEAITYFERISTKEEFSNKTVLFFKLMCLYYMDQKQYDAYKNVLTQQNQDETVKKIIQIYTSYDQNKFSINEFLDMIYVVGKFNINCFIHFIFLEFEEIIYNNRKYSTYKSLVDLFLEQKAKV